MPLVAEDEEKKAPKFSFNRIKVKPLTYLSLCLALPYPTCLGNAIQQIQSCNKQNPACRQRGIPECNLLVTQRLTKYPLLIEQLIKTSKGKCFVLANEDHCLSGICIVGSPGHPGVPLPPAGSVLGQLPRGSKVACRSVQLAPLFLARQRAPISSNPLSGAELIMMDCPLN